MSISKTFNVNETLICYNKAKHMYWQVADKRSSGAKNQEAVLHYYDGKLEAFGEILLMHGIHVDRRRAA